MMFGRKNEQYEDEKMSEEYVHVSELTVPKKPEKVKVCFYVLDKPKDVNKVIDAMREGKTIYIINIKKLQKDDFLELKKAINKIKKTTEAVGGSIVGLSEDIIVVAPAIAKVEKNAEATSGIV